MIALQLHHNTTSNPYYDCSLYLTTTPYSITPPGHMTTPYPSILPSYCRPYGLFIQIPLLSISFYTYVCLFYIPLLVSGICVLCSYCSIFLSWHTNCGYTSLLLFEYTAFLSCPLILLCPSSNIRRFRALFQIHDPSILLYLYQNIRHFCALATISPGTWSDYYFDLLDHYPLPLITFPGIYIRCILIPFLWLSGKSVYSMITVLSSSISSPNYIQIGLL